jgi:demethylmenaquinone methyltransferase / 2-methoxy-6-polyprenyl-1,4-benzoquinol methylase
MIPHPPLASHYSGNEGKPAFVNRLFDAGSKHYDSIYNWGFLHSGSLYCRWALGRHGLSRGHELLDVASGTGMVAVAASKILGSAEPITCLDPSEGMLSVARKKLRARFVVGRAEHLPFPDESFDFLTMGNALRHVTSLEEAFREYLRVLRPGGRILVLEVTKPSGRIGAWLFGLYFGRIFPFLTRIFTGSRSAQAMMLYYWETMDAAVGPESVLAALRSVGFTQEKRISMLGLFSEYAAVKAQAA